MFRPIKTLCTLSLAVTAVALQTGCGTAYTDMYSPRRNYFKAPVEKPTVSELPLDELHHAPSIPQSVELPATVVMPEAAPAAAPELPGLEAAPAPAPEPAMEGAAPAPEMSN